MFKMPCDCESDKKHSNFEQPNIYIVTKPILHDELGALILIGVF